MQSHVRDINPWHAALLQSCALPLKILAMSSPNRMANSALCVCSRSTKFSVVSRSALIHVWFASNQGRVE